MSAADRSGLRPAELATIERQRVHLLNAGAPRTLCGRLPDWINTTGDPGAVTCKACKRMAATA